MHAPQPLIIVMVGNPFDGLTAFGPFDDDQRASDWADGCDTDYWIVEVLKPD